MINYLKKKDFDHRSFYSSPKSMLIDDRIMNPTDGGHIAYILYGGIADKISLSKSKHEKKGDSSFVTLQGKYYCVFPVKTAWEELRIKRTKYNKSKAFLKEAKLIHFDEQEEKKSGFASRIFHTPWFFWVEQNGLYSDGEWIVPPSNEDFYNPTDIVKVQPNIKKEIEPVIEPIAEHTTEEIVEYEALMNKSKLLGARFHRANRMDELLYIVAIHLGKDEKIAHATVDDLIALRSTIANMEKTIDGLGDMPDIC